MKDKSRFDTSLIHAGEPRPTIAGAVTMPIFQNATYEYGGEKSYGDVRYARLSNTPNHLCVGQKIAAAEGTEAAVVAASGMAAITSALLALTEPGDHVLAQDGLYGGTHHFFAENFRALGREVSFFPLDELDRLEERITPRTKILYVESLSNPLLRVPDLPRIAAIARRHGLMSLIDNTFPSPVNFNPAALGFDVILHSATKYLNGHTDIVAGAAAGKASVIRRITDLMNHLGGSLDPHSCFLLNRGMKTLGLRVRQHNANALKLAQALEGHPRVAKVVYPGLRSHPDHARAKELFRGFGGMLSFEYGGSAAEADAFLARLEIPFVAPSLGGVESLITRPVTTSHSGVSPEERRRLGIADTLVRVSVGVEDAEDLIADFLQALGG